MKKTALSFILCFLLLAAAPARTRAANVDAGVIDASVQFRMEQAQIQRLSLGIVKDGSIVYLMSYGKDGANEDIYPIASVSKTFTAFAARQLIDAGILDENAPVQTYLSGFSAAYQGSEVNVSVGQLIRHRSGISVYEGSAPFIYEPGRSFEDAIGRSMQIDLTYKPGTVYEYSNTNYLLLGGIIEAASGQPFEAYINEHILAPLGMNHTYANTTLPEGMVYVHGSMPSYTGAIPLNYRLPTAISPAGGFMSTAEDLCKWIACYQAEGVPLIDKAASAAPLSIYWVDEKPSDSVIFHNGALPGFQSSMRIDTASGWGVVVLGASSDQLGIFQTAPTAYSIAEDVLVYVNEGIFPEPSPAVLDANTLTAFSIIIAGSAAFMIVSIVRAVMRKTKSRAKIARSAFCLAVPILWMVLVPVYYGCGWEWLLVNGPKLNIELFAVLAALFATGTAEMIVLLKKKW